MTEEQTVCEQCGNVYTPGVRVLRTLEEGKCHWVEHMPDGDYQCDCSAGHWRESMTTRNVLGREGPWAHNLGIRLTERDPHAESLDVECACCSELRQGYPDRHPGDPHAGERWRYRGSGAWNCPFCFDVCRALDVHGQARGHVPMEVA